MIDDTAKIVIVSSRPDAARKLIAVFFFHAWRRSCKFIGSHATIFLDSAA